ncbi:ankyrin repeat domain-containing protein [Aquimarina sp. 2201CG5-10]|uniref:ankyrin repeat domain-containing protein n=1 Tax=Aquimarina callyspongiae TaxID=3098150 RepID=UPI002AB338A4|nr:ankyrin repeat domain-containing protein [Aquimarina sp. 2201CG5-10]MDY8135074.1 ankyrin repeat domain-containing protein [Aquimarina sp. 2201CG5-10]
MKSITLVLSLFFCTFMYSQELTKELYTTIKNDNVTKLEKIITVDNIDVCFERSEASYCLLSLAIKTKSSSCFDLLLNKGANTETNCTGKSPLMYASKYGMLDFAKKLIEKGAIVNAKNERGRTALDYAKKYQQQELIDYLSSIQ